MKKPILLSAVVLSTAIAALGQAPRMRHENLLTNWLPAHAAAKKTTASTVRCIAATHSNYASGPSFVPSDSMAYTYSGSRGGAVNIGNFNAPPMKYDEDLVYYNSGGTYTNPTKIEQTFDGNDNILTTTYLHYDAPTSSFVNYERDTFTYDAANNMLTSTYQNWDAPTSSWLNSSKTINTYTPSNNLSTRITLDWTGGAWSYFFKDSLAYSSSDKVISYLRSQWGTSTWDPIGQSIFFYDISDNLTVVVGQSWSSGTWQTTDSVLYSNYAGPGLFQTMIHRSNYMSATMENRYKDSIIYNTDNQPVYHFEADWKTGTSSWATDSFWAVHYYYETPSAITSVNNPTTLKVYPNPASDVINVEINTAASRNTAITVQDVAGHIVRTIGSNDMKEGVNNIQISVEHLPAGAYFVHLVSDKANITRKVIVCK